MSVWKNVQGKNVQSHVTNARLPFVGARYERRDVIRGNMFWLLSSIFSVRFKHVSEVQQVLLNGRRRSSGRFIINSEITPQRSWLCPRPPNTSPELFFLDSTQTHLDIIIRWIISPNVGCLLIIVLQHFDLKTAWHQYVSGARKSRYSKKYAH